MKYENLDPRIYILQGLSKLVVRLKAMHSKSLALQTWNIRYENLVPRILRNIILWDKRTKSSETDRFLIQACKKTGEKIFRKGLQIFQGISKISDMCELSNQQ